MRDGSGLARVARVDLGALRRNLTAAVDPSLDWALDCRADAFGHGLLTIARVAGEMGAGRVLVSDDADAAVLRDLGVRAVTGADRTGALVGAVAYGLDPDRLSEPVMMLTAEIVSVKQAPAGAGVSYGYTYRTPAPTRLGLVALGYADGIPRAASNRARVRVRENPAPVVGLIAMDQFVVDCGDGGAAGADAVLFGVGGPSALDWARWTNRTPLQFTAGLGARIRRTVVEGGEAA